MPIEKLTSIASLPLLLQDGDLLLLDIDETLVSPEADAAEVPWFVNFCEELGLRNPSLPKKVQFLAGVELWQALQGVCDVSPPETNYTADALTAAAAIKGVTCVGLTARGPEIADETVEQLKACGVYDGGIFASDVSLGVLGPQTSDNAGPLPYTHLGGIVYCSGGSKADGLLAYERALWRAPAALGGGGAQKMRRAVLVDDRERHVLALDKTLQTLGRRFLGLHYVPHQHAHESATTTSADSGEEKLGRAWQLLAMVLACRRGRAHLQNMLLALEEGDGASASSTLQRRPSFAIGLLAGAIVALPLGIAIAGLGRRYSR